MSIREQLTIAAGIAVALAATALFPLFERGDWYYEILGVILAVVVTGVVTRRLGLPRALQPPVTLLVLVAYLVVDFAGSSLSHGVVPTGQTVDALRALVDHGREDISTFGPPVPMSRGLLLLTVAGVGAVALVVDVVAVVLDRAAIAGLPLLVLLAVPSAVLPNGIGGLPFVLGAIGWLGLLLVEGSERVGRWGTPMRSALPGARPGGDDSSLGRVGRRIGFSAVALAVVIPYSVPGLDHRLLGGSGGGGGGEGGGGAQAKTFNPITKLSEQLNRETPVQLLQYTTTDPNPDYIRMTTLDTYGNGQWSASKLEADFNSNRVQNGIPMPAGESGDHRGFSMSINVDKLDVNWLPLPYGPTRVDVDGSWLWEANSQTAFSAKRRTEGLRAYRVQASRVTPARETLQAASLDDIDPTVQRRYDTSVKVAPYVRSLTQAILAGKTTEYDQAVALQDYFSPSNGYVYDTKNVSRPTGNEDQLEAFLRGKHGFCEQYATAMAAMLRVAGIPSRVAVGFVPGTLVGKGGDAYFTVTTKEAHAWPEAWFAGVGWVRFEPTPPANGEMVPTYAQPLTPVGPNGPNPGPSSSSGPVPTSTATPVGGRLGIDPTVKTPTGSTSGSGSGVSFWLIAPVAAAVLLVLPFLLTLVRRRRRRLHPGALSAWAQLVDDATDVGYAWHQADSPRAAAARLLTDRRLGPAAADALGRLATAAEHARYAPPGREATGDLLPDVAVVRSDLQAQSPGRVRLRALLFPASTLRWAYDGLSARFSRVLDGVDDAISAATRPLRRRTAPR